MASHLIQEIDQLLGQYYISKNRTDYFDEDGIGKFRSFCNDNEITDIDLQRLNHSDVRESIYK